MVRPTGDINFSYGWTDLYQVRQIADILPYTGTGLRINGYSLGFAAKNGNGWDDGRADLLYAYVQLNGPNGAVFNDTANISYNYDWTRFDLAKTFTDPYSTADITSVRYGFVGKDNNFWAGPYGPEIRDVSFSLNYSVDPCVVDPLSSPSCPGYLAALQALVPTNEPVAESSPAATTTAAVETAPITASTTGPEPTVQSEPQKVAESTPESPGEKKAGASLSTILSIVRSEQDRVASVESRVVEAANEQAQAAADRVTEQALTVAESASTASQALAADIQSMAVNAVTSQSGTQSSSAAVSMSMGPTMSAPAAADAQSSGASESTSAALGSGLLVRPMVINDQLLVDVAPAVISEAASLRSSSNTVLAPVIDAEITESRRYNVGATTAADDFLDSRIPVIPAPSDTAGAAVNRRVRDNEAAAGVGLDAMATQPQGYDRYSMALADRPFYEPREIYRGQRVVDNVRALRQLSSDARHQEMIEQQYRR